MESIKDLFESNNIRISLLSFAPEDLGTSWEVKTIVENPDIFDGIYDRYSLKELSSLNDYYVYLLSIKFVHLRNVIPLLLQEPHKEIIKKLADSAEKEISVIQPRDLIKFINKNIRDIFGENNVDYDMRSITLDYVAKFSSGIDKEAFEFLCNEYGYLLIDRYDQFEHYFEQHPDFFEMIYPTGSLKEIESFRLDKTLDIWCHILKKGKSNLKKIVEKRLDVLEEDIKKLSNEATIDSIMLDEGVIRKFYSFLKNIQSPKANAFAEYAKASEDLLSKNIMERGQVFEYEIPVTEIINHWKKTQNWEAKLLSLTHELKVEKDICSCISRFSKEPEKKKSLIDLVSTNIPTDDFFTMSHQQMLSIMKNMGLGTLLGIIRDKDTLHEYLNLVVSAINIISERLEIKDNQLLQDFEMFSALVQLTANNMNLNNSVLNGICYGASMYICAFSEKLLRAVYMELVKDEKYVPINKATLGELLTVNNKYMVQLFGENHIKNLSFFLQKSPSGIGENIRNSLAHWSNIGVQSMSPAFVAMMLWIFTDILNTVFWYCLGSR